MNRRAAIIWLSPLIGLSLVAFSAANAAAFQDTRPITQSQMTNPIPPAIRRCQSCHSFGRGGPNGIGPNLWGVFGRRAGASPGYRASPALIAAGRAGLVWNWDTLNRYLANPGGFIPSNKMVMRGIDSPQDRATIIFFLGQRR